MRLSVVLIATAVLSAAAAAAAQPYQGLIENRDAQRSAELMAARNRDIAAANAQAAAEVRAQGDQALSNLTAARASPLAPPAPPTPLPSTGVPESKAAAAQVEAGKTVDTPDAALAASNARVVAAAANRK